MQAQRWRLRHPGWLVLLALLGVLLAKHQLEAGEPRRAKVRSFRGTIQAIDPAGRTLTVVRNNRAVTFALSPTVKVRQGKRTPPLDSLKVRDRVRVRYVYRDVTMEAVEIRIERRTAPRARRAP
ncbi:MAG: hypothetical protein HYV08_05920 [Deltaproteobacteria bacterium]|nr:hypothetical protein [Deltaproteobacteria bacterium]MBI3077306.1 hypothetical protein [Deltaproteobacteria bacterium]